MTNIMTKEELEKFDMNRNKIKLAASILGSIRTPKKVDKEPE